MADRIQLSGCAIIDDGKLLLIWKRKQGHYEFPGGKVRPGETLLQTALREVKEELGCDVEIIRYLGFKDFVHSGKYFRSHKFLATIKKGQKPRVAEPKVFRNLAWLPMRDYKKYSVAPNVKLVCEDYISGKLKVEMSAREKREKEIWEALAERWHYVRRKPFPPEVIDWTKDWKPGKLLDVGCGNGRNTIPFAKKGFDCYGIDLSERMIDIARQYLKTNNVSAKLFVGTSSKLPFKTELFDYVLCIAMLHNLDKEGRWATLRELMRVLKPQGKMLITVWNKWQRKFFFGPKEQMIPWAAEGKKYERYYYFYNYFELKRELKMAGFKVEQGKGVFGKNIVFLVSKPF